MKKIYFLTCTYLLAGLFLFSLPSCSDDEKMELDSELAVNARYFSFSYKAGASAQFNIVSLGSWTVDAPGMVDVGNNTGKADWFSVHPRTGTGNATVTITTDYHTDPDNILEAYLTVKGEQNSKEIVLIKLEWEDDDPLDNSLFSDDLLAYLKSQTYTGVDEDGNNTLFPLDFDGDGQFSPKELSKLGEVNLTDRPNLSLKGLEYLSAMTRLVLTGSKIEELDLSANTSLISVYIADCGLNSLALPAASLNDLYASNNNLTEIKGFENLLHIRELDLSNNNISGTFTFGTLTISGYPRISFANNPNLEVVDMGNVACPFGFWFYGAPIFSNTSLKKLYVMTSVYNGAMSQFNNAVPAGCEIITVN